MCLFSFGKLFVTSYKEVWRPVVGQELPLLYEPNNHHDRRVVAIYMDGEVESSESTETRSQ